MKLHRAAFTLAIVASGLVGISSAVGAAEPENSVYFAGYAATMPSAASVTAQATFTVPTLNCADSLGPIEPFAAYSTVEVANGDYAAVAEVVMSCNGNDSVYAGVAIYGTPKVVIHAGDRVRLRVKVETSPFAARATLVDLTTGQSQSGGDTRTPFSPAEAEIGIARSGGTLTDFGKVQWTSATIDGQSLGLFNPERFDIGLDHRHSEDLVYTSPLSPSGGSFRNIWALSS
jgi:Peptidase A4 family